MEERPDFGKIVAFLEGAQTADLVDRHLALLKRVVRACQDGFTLRELPAVSQLLRVVHERSKCP